jgi:ABC-2 type transport system permease protein
VDRDGVETEIPMDDLIEVGAFTKAEDGMPVPPLYLGKHRIRSGEQRLTVPVPERPARAGIDPRHLLIDDVPDDNVAEVAAGAGR